MSTNTESIAIDAMLHAVGAAGWTYELSSHDYMHGDGRRVTINHSATVEDDDGRHVTVVESTAANALNQAIKAMWRARGGP